MRLPRLLLLPRWREPRATDRPPGGADPLPMSGPANSIVAGRTEFAHAFGDLARGKRNWQVIAFAAMGLLGLVTIAYVQLARSARVVPYLVQVDRLGQVVAVGAAERMAPPDERLIASQLAQFLRAIRTVLPAEAAVAQAELVRRGYAFLTPQAAGFLNDYFASPAHDPRPLGTRLTRQVDVTGVLRVPHSDVWRLEWTETERAREPGGPSRSVAWEGYVTVTIVPPATPEMIQDNPLGVRVTSLSWTQVAAGALSPPATERALPITRDTTSDRGEHR